MYNPLVNDRTLRRLTLIAGVLTAIALPVATASAADGPAFGLRVFTGDNPTAAVFHSARCRIKGGRFEAIAHDGGWQLIVTIRPFSGFHPYKLERGYFNGTYMTVDPPGAAGDFASDYVPPYHIPSGGQVSFRNRGNILGGGFYPMFNASGSDAVGVAGGLKCHYPKRNGRR